MCYYHRGYFALHEGEATYYCHGGSLVTWGQPNGGALNGRELIPTIQDTIAGFPRTFLGKVNQKDIPFPFNWPVLYDVVIKDPFRVPASPRKIPKVSQPKLNQKVMTDRKSQARND